MTRVGIVNCPPLILPSDEAMMDIYSIEKEYPALYDYIDNIGIREQAIEECE